jgi:hypothetical protein|tara:strand:+ start:1384 stop:1695 length:312 start_codon:yes stop_codon:yes gene_type:complete
MKRMIEIIMLIERILNDKIGQFNYEVKVAKSAGSRLKGRKKFARQTMRQTTLDEFTEIDGEPRYEHPKTITYTVHPLYLRANELNGLLDELVKDLDIYLHTIR